MNKLLVLFFAISLMIACDRGSGTAGTNEADTLAPREATDPVPEPPTLPDTIQDTNSTSSLAGEDNEIYYRVTGTEPFWSLNIGSDYITYRSMEGDSLSFPYNSPQSAAGRTEEWVQLYRLGEQGWALLRKGNTPCSDGMSDRNYAYTATVWLRGKLLDGCGERQ